MYEFTIIPMLVGSLELKECAGLIGLLGSKSSQTLTGHTGLLKVFMLLNSDIKVFFEGIQFY